MTLSSIERRKHFLLTRDKNIAIFLIQKL